MTAKTTSPKPKRRRAVHRRSDPPAAAAVPAKEFPDASAPQTEAFRRRMREMGEVLSAMARVLADYDPAQWGRGAYLSLLGRVFDRLNGRRTGISLAGLSVLSRIIAEQRRVEAQAARSESAKPGESSGVPALAPDLPEHLREAVRQIYGASLQTDVKEASEAGE